mgnify:CR=1 FL=1|jgi:aspartyl protease family protein
MDANKNKKNSSNYPQRSGWWSVVFWIMLILGAYYLFEGALRHNMNPNQKVQTHTSIKDKKQKKVIVLKRNIYHSYLVSGTLNQNSVTYLVDTGATHVTVPDHIAKKLKLSYGREGTAHTANGKVTIYKTIIPEITIGDIKLKNVPGNISAGLEMDEILLGMSALKHLTIVQQNDKMFLIHYSHQPKGIV